MSFNRELLYYNNIDTSQIPQFVDRRGLENPLGNYKVGSFSRPVFGDIDNDGDLDVFINGNKNNKQIVKYYENIGTKNNPKFIENNKETEDYDDLYIYSESGEKILLSGYFNLVDFNHGQGHRIKISYQTRA